MEFLWITLGAWAAFTAAALLPGFLANKMSRDWGQAHA